MTGYETVTLIRRTALTQDDYGNDIFTDVESEVGQCAVWPTSTTEQVQGQDIVTAGWTVLMPSDTVVAARDRVRVRGIDMDVEGDPFYWVSPITGHQGGVQVNCKRVTG